MPTNGNDDPRLRSYLAFRTTVGYLGMLLPFIVSLGALAISGTTLQKTVSHYYDTVMKGVFVGVLFVIGFFLLFYVGYEKKKGEPRFAPSDNFAGNTAFVFAIAVALFPTTSDTEWITMVHSAAAIGMFATLAYFSIVQFTKTHKGVTPTPEKKRRNSIYRWLGWTIVACIVLIPTYELFLDEARIDKIQPVFWLESLALLAFGVAWAIKGQALGLFMDPAPTSSETQLQEADGGFHEGPAVGEANPIEDADGGGIHLPPAGSDPIDNS
jgi:dipeptide/tripeptide permease